MTATADGSVDGRVLRGQRNREAIVDALMQLYGEGHGRPTAAMVADKAGLSTRSVYHHFDDMKSLILEVSARSEAEWRAATRPPSPELPLDQRIRGFGEHRFARWSITAPVLRAGLIAQNRSATVAQIMQRGRQVDRAEISGLFREELAAASNPTSTLAGLDVVFDFSTWERLHEGSGLSRAHTIDIIAIMASSLIG
ncbi:MAG: TetR/AcrR family transcriptional regulator [Actinomycetia bacterium]|nr:TetR/AcrR family transcriptional regulator [Actinomycetes bacterium]MCP4961744.1 TetR/AcrR family transcriptional regulator [Actinomycetes bacterium]